MAKKKTGTGEGRLEWLPVSALSALRRNPQYLTPLQMDSLKTSLQKDGFLAPILVRPLQRDRYEVISGNHRMMAAREIGLTHVPALICKLNDNSARRVAINLNTVHGDPPAELLAPFLAELDDETLREIRMDPDLLQEIAGFDALLAERLASLEAPDKVDRPSPHAEIATCVCSRCGKRHIRQGVEETQGEV